MFAGVKEAGAYSAEAPKRVADGYSVAGAVGGTSAQTPAWIPAEAEYLSGGRKLTVVCAATAQAWVTRLTEVAFPASEADEYYGFSLIRRGEIHLSPYVCEGLRLGTVASTRRSHELQVAWSVNVLLHESTHVARFTLDEKLAEACARIALPIELHRLYGVAYHGAEMRRLTTAAAWFRSTQAPEYQGGTCPTAGG